MLEDVADAGVCVCRGSVRFGGKLRQCLFRQMLCRCLLILHIEMFHGQPPAHALAFDAWDHRASARPGSQKCAGRLQIANGGRKPDAPWIHPSHAAEPFHQTNRLTATVATHQRMHLVNDYVPQVVKQLGECGVFVEQHRLQRLRRDLQNARGMFQHLCLVGLGNVAVPVPDRDASLGAEVVQPEKLVVDKRFQRSDVDSAHRGGRVFVKLSEDGKKRRLGLTGGGGGGEQDVFIRVENGIACCDLDGTQGFPVVLVDKVLDKWGIAFENGHGETS